MSRLKTALARSLWAIAMTAAWSPASAAVNCADLVKLKILTSEIGLPSGGAAITSAQMATVAAAQSRRDARLLQSAGCHRAD
jgi:hypothetical protein